MTEKSFKEDVVQKFRLSEFVVVLCVTLVLAAILMPAIAGHDPERAESILNSADTLVVFDGIVKSSGNADHVRRSIRRENRQIQADARAEIDRAHNTDAIGFVEPYQLAGSKKLLTTDIRYRQP